MTLPALQPRHYRADILTQHYVFAGVIEPFGPLMTYLNDASRGIVVVKNVEAVALDAGNVMDTFRAEELMVTKEEVIAIRLADPVSTGTVQLLARREKLLVFTPRFIIQAFFHCGPDSRLGDMFEAMSGRWAPASDANVHPLLPARKPVFHTASLLLVNKQHIRFYEAVKS